MERKILRGLLYGVACVSALAWITPLLERASGNGSRSELMRRAYETQDFATTPLVLALVGLACSASVVHEDPKPRPAAGEGGHGNRGMRYDGKAPGEDGGELPAVRRTGGR